MDPEKQRELARKGGSSVAAANRSFSRDPQLAAEAGRKGGMRPKANKGVTRNKKPQED